MEKQFDRIPEHLKPKNRGTDTLFQNSLIERLTRTHISIPVTMHGLIVIGFVYLSMFRFHIGFWRFAILFIGGWFTWSLAEYWVHRWLYHVKTENKLLLRIQHVGHGIHHQYPKDPTRLAMPPVPALIILTIFFSIFYLIFHVYTVAFFPGFLLGYLLYISLHYAQHRFKPPRFQPLNGLWKWHALHHYKYPETKAFGVSTRIWDYVFGTTPD